MKGTQLTLTITLLSAVKVISHPPGKISSLIHLMPKDDAHSFLTKPTRFRRNVPDCNTNEQFCENNKDICKQFNEQSREHFCKLEQHSCPSSQACYLTVPCPAHYEIGCSNDQCDGFPCQNGGTCTSVGESYTCTCAPGYSGTTDCAKDINECASNPCQNGATCTDMVNKYECTCVPGFTGQHCETNINECASYPCQNGATCTDMVNRYACTCVPGFTGQHCETNINECQSAPCLNEGSCKDLINAFSCHCTDRYEGKICEKDCRPGPADIIFIVDTSESQKSNVYKSVDYISQFVRRIPIGPGDFQVGVVTYSFDPVVIFDLNDHNTSNAMIDVVKTIRKEEGVTLTTNALHKAYELLTSGVAGARSGTVYKYVILLYDGLSTDSSEALEKAALLNVLGIRIYTVAFGDSISHTEMLKITNNQYYAFSPLKRDDLFNQMMKETADVDCPDCSLETAAEVILLVDTAFNQTFANFNNRILATRHTIDKLLSYNSDISIGMYSYSDELDQIFDLAWSNDKDQLIGQALKVDRDTHLSTSDTGHALHHIRKDTVFKSARKMVVILSNGNSFKTSDVKSELTLLANDGIDVMSVMAGDDSDSGNFRDVFPDPSYIFHVWDDDFSAIESLATMTQYYECVNNLFTKRQ